MEWHTAEWGGVPCSRSLHVKPLADLGSVADRRPDDGMDRGENHIIVRTLGKEGGGVS